MKSFDWPQIALVVAAALLAGSVLVLNGQTLIYFDTAGYLEQGARMIHLSQPDAPGAVTAPVQPAEPATTSPRTNAEGVPDSTVVGSRSSVYGLLLALIVSVGGLTGVTVGNLAVIGSATWLLSRRLLARDSTITPSSLAAVGIIAACTGSLPFYVAFAMPDIFAPVLILTVAVLFSTGGAVTRLETGLAVVLALLAILVHPSHLLILGLLAPVAAFFSPRTKGRRLAIALLIVGGLAGAGLAERFVFNMAVERFLHKQVVYLPFVTARLIDDGPGLRLLEDRCPDADYPTCLLLPMLQASVDPSRFDAPNILFARSPERGSYRRLVVPDQIAVAGHQMAFLGDVLRADPSGVVTAIARNVAIQLSYVSVEMTVPTPDMVSLAETMTKRLPRDLEDGRLVTPGPGWAPVVLALHAAAYLASLAVLALLYARRQIAHGNVAVTVMVISGIVANAIVCGAVSEPAHRYGARVMFLLPMLASMLWTIRPRRLVAAAPGPR